MTCKAMFNQALTQLGKPLRYKELAEYIMEHFPERRYDIYDESLRVALALAFKQGFLGRVKTSGAGYFYYKLDWPVEGAKINNHHLDRLAKTYVHEDNRVSLPNT